MPKGQHAWYSPEEKMNIIQLYFSSNCTIEKFCGDQNISRSTLYKWLKIYNEANNTSSSLPATSFQNVTPIIKQDVDPIIKSTTMKLKLPNNITLEFESIELHNVLMELK